MKYTLTLLLLAAAATATAQTTPPKSIAGTVTGFRTVPLSIGVKSDTGPAEFARFGPETEVLRISPGERDLARAQAGRMTDISVGDRVLISFADGMDDARRIVLISADDIARRNEAERQDWQKRGISGIVASRNDESVVLEMRSMKGVQTITVAVTAKTKVRRYAPDSVKFADAGLSGVGEIAVGDQLRVRGNQNAEGSKVTAEDVVFGTFQTRIGSVVSVDIAARRFIMEDLTAKQPVTIKLTGDTQLKSATFRAASPGEEQHTGPAPAFSITQMLQQLPAAHIEDLKVGGAAVVTSTRGSKSGEVTAIMVIANADALLKMAAQGAVPGENPMDAINRMHGGMLGGPGGVNLPALLP